ncbi:MAG: hypothetical protein M5U09_11455 [Gammaproteobacteria bacterium]|nr:hypothetical protein [Gammaproteobacteria bacterium]
MLTNLGSPAADAIAVSPASRSTSRRSMCELKMSETAREMNSDMSTSNNETVDRCLLESARDGELD